MSGSKPLHMPPVNPDTLPAGGLDIVFEADEAERTALAERFNLIGLKSFRGQVQVRPWRKHGVMLSGRLKAEVTQSCVVTLEPVESKLDEAFTARFLPAELMEPEVSGSEREIVIDPESEDPPESFEGALDMAEALAEQLALALDPYPRKPGVHFEAKPEEVEIEDEKRPNPFAALEKLKKKD